LQFDESEARRALTESIVESSNDAIMSGDLKGNFTSWNPAAEKIFGYSAQEMIGQNVLLLVPPDNKQQIDEFRAKILAGHRIEHFESVRIKKDGSEFPVSLTISPIRDLTGAIVGTSTIARDLTEKKQASQNADKMASIIDCSNDAIISASLDGTIESWNPAAEKMHGYSAEEMIGQSTKVLYHPDSPYQRSEILAMIMANSLISNFEVLRVRKDGSSFPATLSVSPIHDPTGVIIGTSSITRDMTDRDKAEQKFRDILESSPDAMIIVDQTGTIAIVNSQTEKIFGYTRDEMLGQPVELLVPSRFQTNLHGYRDSFRANPEVQSMGGGLQLLGLRKDGIELPVEVRLSPIETADGAFVVATIHDVTEHRQLIRRLEDLNELRNEFVAVVTHDLRSPMTSISGYAHLLIDAWDTTSDDEKIDYLQIIARNTERLSQFVEDALQVARIEMGEYTFEIVALDIRSLVQRALGEAEGANADRQFEFTALADIPLVLGDADRQWQVLTNLLSNAVKFSPTEEPITVTLSRDGDFVQVAVTDRGIGIAEDDIAKLFQKFGRISQSGGGNVPGNGLGLFICKTLVEAQGGRIWCESSPDQGSTFFYTIPIEHKT